LNSDCRKCTFFMYLSSWMYIACYIYTYIYTNVYNVYKMSIRFLKAVGNIYYFCNIYYRYLIFPDVKYYSGKYNSSNGRRFFFFYPLPM